MRTQKTPAVVLRRTNYGEADRIIQLLTPTGKKSVIAKGARREKSRLSGGIELFALCEVVIAEGKGDIGTLTSSRLVRFYRHIIEDYDRMQFAYVAIKLVSNASETIDGQDWYDILLETIAGLDAKTIQLNLVEMWFYLRYSKLLGYELSLWHDIDGKKIEQDKRYRYDVTEKSLIIDNTGNITSEHIKLLRLVATKSLKIVSQIGGVDGVSADCLLIVKQHASI